MDKLQYVLDKLEKFCNPVSIFLYGSRARNDFLKRSDFELGILIPKKRYVKRGEIKKIINEKKFNVYPFEYEDFLRYKIDTPFQKTIYLRELILSGKTLRGKKIIENMKPPSIKVIDILQRIRFDIGVAFASVFSYRYGSKINASLEFSKSCLFGLRCMEILKLKKFPLTYGEIYNLSGKLKLEGYEQLVTDAFGLRLGKSKFKEENLFKNISFLNKFIEPKILKYFERYGNKILIA